MKAYFPSLQISEEPFFDRDIRNIETTKQRLEQLAEKYKGINANADKYVEHPPVPDKNLSIV